MASEQPQAPTQPYTQLEQVKVPLDEAADAFMVRDASGRLPIVVVPSHPNRIRNDFVLAGVIVLIGGILASVFLVPFWMIFPGTGLALVLFGLGVFRAFLVPVPEGASGMLTRGGRYVKTIGSGTHFVPLWVVVSHLVTRREIPFDVQVIDAPTSDTVRVAIDALLTFRITDPFAFVYTIAADDFDEVLQAAGQEAIRTLVRSVTVDEVFNFTDEQMDSVRETIGPDVGEYGVEIIKVTFTYIAPPLPFMLTEEQRQLAVRQLEEQSAKQMLAERLQADSDTLERQRLLAFAEREKDKLLWQQEQADERRRMYEREAEAEELRLARLEDRLRHYPVAAEYDAELQRLDVARALAGNTRAILQVGSADDISRLLVMRHALYEDEHLSDLRIGAGDGSVHENGSPVVESEPQPAAVTASDENPPPPPQPSS
jgi:regulator of protease activity HflC (stomatin/prohibitin superfamily)